MWLKINKTRTIHAQVFEGVDERPEKEKTKSDEMAFPFCFKTDLLA